MKILAILEHNFPPDVRVEQEIRTLTAAGHQVFLLASSKTKNPPIEKSGNFEIHRVYQSPLMLKFSALALSLPFYFSFWRKHIRQFLKNQKVDLIHLHDLPLASVVYQLGKEFHLPVIFDFHENRPEIMKLYAHTNTPMGKLLISKNKWENYQSKFSGLADRLILVTPEARLDYQKRYGVKANTTYVVPNYADIDFLNSFQTNAKITDKYKNKFMLVYFGDTGLRRGTGTIIEAARMLKENTVFHFVIIGRSKEQDHLKEKIAEYGLKNVDLTGYINFSEIISYISASKIGLCPFLRNLHHDTTYANKMFQMMYFGKPLIVSDCPAQAHVVEKENCGLVFEAGNARQLADSILKLYNDPRLLSEMGKRARESVIREYNTKNGNQALLDLYKSFEKTD